MAYIPLYQKFYTTYHLKPDGILKPENIKYKVFLKAVANYPLTVNSGFDTLYLKKNTECAIHLLRMLLDATIKTYGLLLAKNPEKYINDYLKGSHSGDYASRSDNKYDGKSLLDGNIIPYMEADGYPIRKFYDEANRYIHPSNFYCLGIEQDEETKKWLWDSQDKALVKHTAKLNDRTEREWVYNVMGLVNETLIEIMGKVAEMIEPRPIATFIIDLEKGGLVPNPEYKEIPPTELVSGIFLIVSASIINIQREGSVAFL